MEAEEEEEDEAPQQQQEGSMRWLATSKIRASAAEQALTAPTITSRNSSTLSKAISARGGTTFEVSSRGERGGETKRKKSKYCRVF